MDARLLALDVSSSACGWALLWCPGGTVDAFGVIVPKTTASAVTRIDAIVAEVTALLVTRLPERVVLEWSAGKVHGGAKSGYSGLAVLGQAQGAVYQAVKSWQDGSPPETVPDIEWTGGTKKTTRARKLALVEPAYAMALAKKQDLGFDAADAICLGRWVLARDRERALIRRGSRRP